MNNSPFWEDELETQAVTRFPLKGMERLFRAYQVFLSSLVLLGVFVLLYFGVEPLLAWLWFFVISFTIGFGFYQRKQRQEKVKKSILLQEEARRRTGASLMGSAVHVAGHPCLEREQAIVMAMVGSEICFFAYDGAKIDVLPVQEIVSLHTVVYDDERVPHIEAVDSTAQALQITFRRKDKDFTALFRSMKKVRPIDWYHAIQKLRSL